MKKNIGKVFGKARLLCFALLLSLCSALSFSLPVNAASVFNYDRWFSISNANYSSGTLSFPANNISGTSAVNIPANGAQGGSNWKKTSITFIAPNTPPATEYINGNSFTTTFSLVTNNPYMGNTGTSRAVDITCPVLDTRFNTTDCQLSSVEQTFDERHYIIWNFVITGTISQTTDSDRITAQLDIVNYSDAQTTLWVLPARSAYGEGSFQVIRNILGNVQQMNQYIADISTALTNSNNYLSTIQSLVNQILTKMDNANVAGVITQQQATNQKLDAQAQQDATDRSNLTNQQDDIQDDADDVSDDVSSATSSLSQNVSSIIGAFSTNATDCNISVTTGDQGVLQLTNMNVCNLPTEMHNLIHTVVAIMITIAVLLISFNLINQVISLIEEFYGTPGGKLWI